MTNTGLQVEVFKGEEASVNGYVFCNGQSVIIMDALRSSENAKGLAWFVRAKGLPVTHILITHGHPDHYIGMDVLTQAFPHAQIVVAREEIKRNIIGFSQWMESVGWLDGEPRLKPRSDQHPDGFDYEGKIQVLQSGELTLEGGGTLALQTNYASAEAEHLTTVFSKELNAFFTADFCYNGVHLWLGQGVDQEHIDNWKQQLHAFRDTYAGTDVVIYPGHGKPSTPALFDVVLKYIADFEDTIQAAKSKDEAIEKMKNLYPSWEQEGFLLLHSVDYHMGLKSAG